MKYCLSGVFIIGLIILVAFREKPSHSFTLKTKNGHLILVSNGAIYYDNTQIFKYRYDDIIYDSKFNRLINDHNTQLLFIANDDKPSLDKMDVFIITPLKAKKAIRAILSPVKDYDKDGCLEFGGSDLTEYYDNPDSMYYVPSVYYEIRNGNISKDKALTRSEERELNGIYIANPYTENGCCKVVPKPKNQ